VQNSNKVNVQTALTWSTSHTPSLKSATFTYLCSTTGGCRAGCIHLCRVAGNTVWSHMAGDVPQLSLTTIRSCTHFYCCSVYCWLVLQVILDRLDSWSLKPRPNSYFSEAFSSWTCHTTSSLAAVLRMDPVPPIPTYRQGSHNFTSTKFQDFSRTNKLFFQNLLEARQCLNAKTNSLYLLYIQSVIQCTKLIVSKNWNAK